MIKRYAAVLATCACALSLGACLETVSGFECSAVANQEASVRADSVVTTSGLIYRELTVGTGAPVQTVDRCQRAVVRYEGRLLDGTVFSQTADGQTFAVEVGSHVTITGFEQGLVGMRVGGVRQLIIPPALGYGPNPVTGGGVTIPANSTLVFDVELLAVQD